MNSRLIIAVFAMALLTPVSQAGAADYKNGFVSMNPCPHSCRSVGLKKEICRDWKEDEYCFVEDLRKPRQSNPPKPPVAESVKEDDLHPAAIAADDKGLDACNDIKNSRLARPHIDIHKVDKTGNFFTDKYKIHGTLEGNCLIEAGYYEDGELIDRINVEPDTKFQRYKFAVVLRPSDTGEIRVYNVRGDRDVKELDVPTYLKKQGGTY